MKFKPKHIQLFEGFIKEVENTMDKNKVKDVSQKRAKHDNHEATENTDEDSIDDDPEDIVAEFERHFSNKKY